MRKEPLPLKIFVSLENGGTSDEFFDVSEDMKKFAAVEKWKRVGEYKLSRIIQVSAEPKILEVS